MNKKTFYIGLIILLINITIYLLYSILNIIQFELFELKSLDVRYHIKRKIEKKFFVQKKEKDVVIIGIDEKSLNNLGSWPWNRAIHGKLVKKMKEYDVKVVGFDIAFTEKKENTDIIATRNELKKTTLEYYKKNEISEEAAKKIAGMLNKIKFIENTEFEKSMSEV